jgi:two-component system chemotaxis response regulator CheY
MSRKVLVVDDSKTIRLILSRFLQELGFQVVEAADGRQALERLRQGDKPSLALVDWNMPEMNGYEFLVQMRADHAFDDVPVMMVTTENELSHVSQALEAGATEYVMKPFNLEIITEKLRLTGCLED